VYQSYALFPDLTVAAGYSLAGDRTLSRQAALTAGMHIRVALPSDKFRIFPQQGKKAENA
jgi:ABC-type Fe3+/spermidine/putrescine transport system ATPase subunit